MKARIAAESGFANRPSIITDSTDSTRPTASASPGVTLPEAAGRLRVRAICASMSASHHMFSAPEAPAPTAMQMIAAMAITGCTGTGAAIIPAAAVKIDSDITRGLSSAK